MRLLDAPAGVGRRPAEIGKLGHQVQDAVLSQGRQGDIEGDAGARRGYPVDVLHLVGEGELAEVTAKLDHRSRLVAADHKPHR